MMESISRWGFEEQYLEDVDSEEIGDLQPARVTSVFRNQYLVTDGQAELKAELVGRLSFAVESSLDLPAVGDWVLARVFDGQGFAVIERILPRKTLMTRKTPGRNIDFQVIAANVDTAFLVQSLDDNFSLRRLERYMAMVLDSGITPLVLLSKSDLLSDEESLQHELEITGLMPGVSVLCFSNTTDDWQRVLDQLEQGKTYCLLGSSGVGKTTLLNNLLGEAVYETGSVREFDSKGRHTTTYRQLIQLKCGALIVDTPGMRELGNFAIQQGLDETFTEITELAESCRFSDCTHTNEPGCAVIQAVQQGVIDEGRYRSYLQLQRESEFGEMSYAERRSADRKRGKFYRTVMKSKTKRR